MPRIYKRKVGVVPRTVTWTEEALTKAIKAIESNSMKTKTAAKQFGIPSRTLRRRLKNADLTKHNLGKGPILGYENEKKLVDHIKNLEKAGFPCTRMDIRRMAYQLAVKLKISHNFNEVTKLADKQWLLSFLERNKQLSVRQAEGISRARPVGFNREEIGKFFDLLEHTLITNDVIGKPKRIFNMDESRVQMNNKPEKVVVTKGAKLVQQVTSSERGETISVVACNNAEGRFLPPIIILKGVYKKDEFLDGLPPGSDAYMNKKSAYINTDLFYKWLTEHFIPRKPAGKVLLILDGHSSHTVSLNTLEVAKENDVILLGLPSHSTHGLQPLDKSFFKPFKTYFSSELRNWMINNKEKRINRYQSGKLIGSAWIRATTPSNAINGFRACGIHPFNPNIIPDHYFEISDAANRSVDTETLEEATGDIPDVSDVVNPNNLVSASSERTAINESQLI
ncbi:MFS-type transporter clz9-like [Leptopilina heterotoma]|uniref:MFS-type transporter clz9-like n=1 Tax=Leptopilina heterotoma TaxID=63436 RepID=UPI001CA9D203|nr:MFS-type transporter clz9-like [Leptopilina heterotoma]